jgi:hypothetical protein
MLETKIPSWLDESAEIKKPDQPEYFLKLNPQQKSCMFILLSLKSLIEINNKESFGLSLLQMLDVIGNAIIETGWGLKWRGWNFGGWKISKDFVESYKKTHGVCPPWWRAKGHIKAKDDPVVYYRGFNSPIEFYKEWLLKFVPKNTSKTDRYYKTGQAFWSGGNWFYELCVSGYKGEVTKANPEPSVKTFKSVLERLKIILAQYILSLTPDGIWGEKSKKACQKFQLDNRIEATGILNDITLIKLIELWIKNGMPINISS